MCSAVPSLLGDWALTPVPSALPVRNKVWVIAQVESKVACNTRCYFYTSGLIPRSSILTVYEMLGTRPKASRKLEKCIPLKKITSDIPFVCQVLKVLLNTNYMVCVHIYISVYIHTYMYACINEHICIYYVPIIQWFTKISLQNTALGSASLTGSKVQQIRGMF